ncbi:MAG: WD40/YVTN/BNR-like repeat-containing protein [Candidatus Acidiferrales bacterium]
MNRVFANLILCTVIVATFAVPSLAQRRRGEGSRDQFRFRFIGPTAGNRVASVAGVPGDPSLYYAGAASGGVWKTTDGGIRWAPIFDKEPVAAIGALAVAPSDPNVVWVGTGEAWAIRDTDVMGNGVYKSTDAGKTWKHMGLDATGRIGRVIVNPRDENDVFVCALGRTTGPQQERGVYRTTNGGKNWERVLFVDENTGCSGLVMDPQDPNVLFAGTWQIAMHTWGEFSGGPGSGVYVSRDGGTKWTRIEGHGLPKPPVGKIDVVVAPTDSERVYALIQTKDQGSVWRSDDGGENWRVVNWQRPLIGRAGYYIRIAVSPANEDEVYIANSSFFESVDGGETFKQVPWGGDNHDIWVDPKNPNRFALTNDAGLLITTDHGKAFNRVTLPIGQMYHVAVDNQVPYYVYSNMQDDGNMRGPSTSFGFAFGGGEQPGWDHAMGGCESGWTLPDLANPNIVWATCYGNEVTVWDARTKMARSVSPWIHTLDSPPNETKYRCHWTPPLAIDPFDNNTVYYGCQVIFKTSDGGEHWSVISPDLSTNDPSKIVSSGGIVGDNLGQFYGEVVFAIAPSQKQRGLIWAGTNDGQVWYTKDGGGHWNNVTKNISGLPAWGTVTSIEPSHFEAGTAYISIDFHLMDNRDPYIYKTTNFGQSWTQVSGDLPKSELSYVRVVAEDPNCKGLLFAGTGNDLYYSSDDGAHWKALDEGLPHATVSWAVVQKQFHDLVVSTYGRGLYILDDITPLEQMATEHSDAAVRFFAPRATYRLVRGGRAILDYSLKSATKDPVQIEILDDHGTVIRKLKAPSKVGMNRTAWDLRYEPPHVIALRTAAPDNPHIWEEPRFRGKNSRPVTHWGIEGAQVGPLAAPGKYTLRLTANGLTVTQSLTILKDPHARSTDADISSSVKTLLRIRDDITHTSDMVNRIEWMRKQLEDVNGMLAGQKSKADLRKSVEEMDQKMEAVEFKLLAREQANSDDKYYTDAYKVYLNLIWLNGEVGTGAGDVAGGADFAPTPASLEVLQNIEKSLAEATADYRYLMTQEVPAFDRSLTEQGITPLTAALPSDGTAESATP